MGNSYKFNVFFGLAAFFAFAAPSLAQSASALPDAPGAPQSAAQPVLTPRQQKIEDLIRQVEAAYAAGEADYHKGKLPEAKDNFDHAVDLLLASGFDLRAEARLSDEFDHIVDGVNALEMEALKQGNGFAAPEEEAPAEAAADITFNAVDPQFVAKAKADLATTRSDLPLVMNDYVATFVNFFANTKKGHNTLLHSLQRGGRYRAMIQRVMAEEGVPQDLIYLAVAESGFNPRALNRRSHAGGMWQFMPNDKFYGLARTAYVDERFDPEKSTRAYARYMRFIYDQLGDWYLSMAAYDHGTGNMQHAIARTGYADFWELYKRNNLPKETANYVPEIIAAIIIANNPLKYGFDEITLDPPVLTDTVTLHSSVDLRLVADIVQAPMEEMTALNPSLLRRITPPDASFDLHLPAGTGSLFEKEVARIPEDKRVAWRYHRVHEGDSLASVAREYHVSSTALAQANQLEDSAALAGVDALAVPTTAAAQPLKQALTYTARKGDTLVTIADRFGISLDQLRRWNNITGIKVAPGRKLRISDTASDSTKSTHKRTKSGSSAAAGKDAGADSAAAAEKDSSAKKSTTESGSKPSTAKKSTHSKSHKHASTGSKSGHAKAKKKKQ